MGYGQIIQRLRGDLPYVKFAKLTGISKSHLERIEKEHSNKGKDKLKIPIDTLKQICDRTNYPFRQFLEEAGYIEAVTAPALTSLQLRVAKLTEAQQIFINNTIDDITGDGKAATQN